MATTSQTINITTNSLGGWSLYMEVTDPGNQSSTGDTNTNKDANLINTTQQSSTTNPYTIASLPEEAVPSLNTSGNTNTLPLEDNTWGIAMPYGAYSDDFSPRDDYTSTDQDILKDTKWASPKYLSNTSNPRQFIAARYPSTDHPDTRTIYYGVRVDNPSTTPAGDYQAGIVYTAIANLPPAPTITTITPNTYTIGSNDPTTITIEGTNLASTYDVWIDLDKDNVLDSNNELCAIDKDSITDTKLTCTIPTPSSTLTINPDTYNLYLRTQANDLATATFTYTTPPAGTVCRNADPNSDCQVDIDANMIPIYYDEAKSNAEGEAIWKVANPNDPNNPGSWYDYTNKKWANAVTVTKAALDANKYQNPGTTIDNNDVLGYWVYIPRYAYEVQRPNAVDRVVTPQNFNIRFETAEDTKKIPASSCNLGIKAAEDMWEETIPSGTNSTNEGNAGPDSANVKAKDYRKQCAAPGNTNGPGGTEITRDYPDNNAELANGHTTWATHPAFSWLDSEGNGTELNGIWVGKFETTGTRTNPTVKPNQRANISEHIGNFYTMAKHIGIYDENNAGGNDVTLNGTTLYAYSGEEWTSLHNLKTTTSHMLKNSEWGAAAYLASSIYGAGIDEETGESNVSINSAYPITGDDADGDPYISGITGCGPKDIDRSTGLYISVTTSTGETVDLPALSPSHIEDPLACGDTAHSYIGNIGVLASTTNNVYGIYDMSGGTEEYVMGNLSNSSNKTSATPYFHIPTEPPYVDIYLPTDFSLPNKPGWSAALPKGSSEVLYNNDICTWGNCGGHALHETKLCQSVSIIDQSWGGNYSNFADSNDRWFLRGSSAGMGPIAGLFSSYGDDGYDGNGSNDGFRAVLSP